MCLMVFNIVVNYIASHNFVVAIICFVHDRLCLILWTKLTAAISPYSNSTPSREIMQLLF